MELRKFLLGVDLSEEQQVFRFLFLVCLPSDVPVVWVREGGT